MLNYLFGFRGEISGGYDPFSTNHSSIIGKRKIAKLEKS